MSDILGTNTGTIITLTCNRDTTVSPTNDLMPLIKVIESKFEDKKGLEVYIKTSFGKSNRVHHHILVNREVNIDIENEWKNGLTFIENIKSDDHYKRVLKYIMC